MTENPKYKDNLILKLTFEFALDIIRYVEKIDQNKRDIIGRQLLRCGTSIGANVKEAQNAESSTDFIHKLKISLKEVDETEYWLFLCRESGKFADVSELLIKLNSISKILNKIVGSSKKQIEKTKKKIITSN